MPKLKDWWSPNRRKAYELLTQVGGDTVKAADLVVEQLKKSRSYADQLLGEVQEREDKPDSKKPKAEAGPLKSPKGTVATARMEEAGFITIKPKEFTTTSGFLWQAMEAAKREWGYPKDITPDDFLDSYLYESFRQRGIVLGAYQIINEEE